MNLPIITILCLAFVSCSRRTTENNPLPRYSDMSAAQDAMDAGKAK